MKYFFLSEGWKVARVWGTGGLWSEIAWRRQPDIQRLKFCLQDKGETLWLHRVEDAVVMVEVKPTDPDIDASQPFAQVVLKRLMSAEQVIDLLCEDAGDRP